MKSDLPQGTSFQDAAKTCMKRFSTVLKMAAVAVLVLLLLIPLSMVRSVLNERLQRRESAVREITSTWGDEQVLFGPVLIVPFKYRQKSWNDRYIDGRVERVEADEIVQCSAYFLPADFKAEGRLEPGQLHRGIYKAVVYSGTLNFSGVFAKPSFEEWGLDVQQILWNEAEIAVAITDLRGAKESLHVSLDGREVPLMPGSRLDGFKGGVYGRAGTLGGDGEAIPFSMSLTLNGSRGLRFAPAGVNNDVRLSSNWPDPSFQGAFLPAERNVNPGGFTARWKVSYYGRSYPQQWTSKTPPDAAAVASSLFGVDLVPVMDSYRYVERSIKYGILLIVLLFTAFFLFEILSSVRVHPFQYTLVGVALCLFYLILLALSEVIPFTAAYWTGAAMAMLMVALYSAKVLRSARRGCLVGLGLVLVYAFLFIILRMQDYALLVGTAGLFLVLAVVMFVTRNIDWYARDNA